MILLRPFVTADFDQLIGWSANEEMLMQYAGPSFDFPLTTEQLALNLADASRLAYSIQFNNTGEVIGHAEIYFPNKTTAHLCRILIGDAGYRGRGIGSMVVKQLLAISFAIEGVEEASLNVYDWNQAAVKCYTSAGFEINKNSTRTGQVKDKVWTTLNMRLAKKKWANL